METISIIVQAFILAIVVGVVLAAFGLWLEKTDEFHKHKNNKNNEQW